MSKTPRQRAEACFAVARSTTHDGERTAAISRGEFVCKRHGLSLDDFDIPGRARKVPAGRMRGGSFDIDLDLNAFHARQSAYSTTQEDLFGHAAGFSMDDLAAAFEAMSRAGRTSYSPFHEFGTINRPERPRPTPPPKVKCPKCGHVSPAVYPVRCSKCGG